VLERSQPAAETEDTLAALEQARINLLPEPEGDGGSPRLRLPRPRHDAPAFPFQAALQTAPHEAIGACDGAEFRIGGHCS